jgi:hypothetical protein
MQRRLWLVGILLIVAAGPPVAVSTMSAFSGSTANPGSAFSAAASFCGTNPTPIWLTGMEAGILDEQGTGHFFVTAGAAVDASVKRSGNYSLYLNKTGTGSADARVTVAGGPGVLVLRFALRFVSLPAANVDKLAYAAPNGGNVAALGYDSATQKLKAHFITGNAALASTTVSTGTWYLIDMKIKANANPHTIDWRIGGVAQSQATDAASATTINTPMAFGSNTSADRHNFNVDDMTLSTTEADYPIGDGHIYGLAPDSIGTVNDPSGYMQNDDGTAVGATSWQRLDELPMSALTDYVKQTANDANAYATIGFANVASGCVRGVSALAVIHSSATQANSAKTSIFDGATERVVFQGDMSPGAAAEHQAATIAPASGSWDITKLNGLVARVGYATDASPVPYWDALLLEYDAG